MSTATAHEAAARDNRILCVISIGHFMSHFYYMALPPLFVQMRDEFGVSYAQLGLVIAVMFAASAIVQVPVGALVDRIGARSVLTVGLLATALTIALMGVAPSFWLIVVLSVLSGIANAVFHPTDYAILNSSISANRMGRAFSIHTFSGQMGTAAAPVAIIALESLLGWRMALVVAGALGGVAMLLLATQWHAMREEAHTTLAAREKNAAASSSGTTGLAVLMTTPMLLFFGFFTMLALTQGGMQSFLVAALVSLHDTPVSAATTALSVYLFASAAGTLLGGDISDRIERHDLLAGGIFVLSAMICLCLAWFRLHTAVLVLAMAAMGIAQGITRPARDLMLRAATPHGATGRVFGFASTGIAVGAGLAPIPFGWLVDIGRPAWVFYLLTAFMVLALATVMTPQVSSGRG